MCGGEPRICRGRRANASLNSTVSHSSFGRLEKKDGGGKGTHGQTVGKERGKKKKDPA